MARAACRPHLFPFLAPHCHDPTRTTQTHTYTPAYMHLACHRQIMFYERAGFVADAVRVENYYKRIENPHAVILRRKVQCKGEREMD